MNSLIKNEEVALIVEDVYGCTIPLIGLTEPEFDIQLHLMKENTFTLSSVLVFCWNSQLVEISSKIVEHLIGPEIIEQWGNDLFKEYSIVAQKTGNEDCLVPLTIIDIDGSFILLLIEIGISTTIFALEFT